MLKGFRKTKKEQLQDALSGTATPEKVEMVGDVVSASLVGQEEVVQEEVTYEPIGMREIKSFDDMTDDEILARADTIQARLNRVQEQEQQKAADAERNLQYQKYAAEEDKATRARRITLYDEANRYLPKLDEIFGDSLPKSMKCALAVLISKTPDDRAQYNPGYHKLMAALEDYFAEEATRAQA